MPSSRPTSWKSGFRSLYYQQAPEPADPILERGKLALLVIDALMRGTLMIAPNEVPRWLDEPRLTQDLAVAYEAFAAREGAAVPS